MIIRQAIAFDSKAIQSLLAQLGYPDLTDEEVALKIVQHEKPGYYILVAEVDEKVIGFISMHWFELMHWKGPLGRFTSFCIDESFRSKGIGTKLLESGEKFLTQKGCIKLEVTSNLRRKKTHEFYLRLGYTEDSRRFVKYPVQ
ncbi:MAG: GNAT family N-acetyltransferase [Cyclobacteriaceae bacterium]|nr:GNAT family N-acetyltransferase [Cyclobacteriaceae bacterium]